MDSKFEQESRSEERGNFDRCFGFPHVIQKGDTLYKLSRQYHVKVSALILANPYADVYNLQIGDEICIPRVRPVVIPVVPRPPQGRPCPAADMYAGEEADGAQGQLPAREMAPGERPVQEMMPGERPVQEMAPEERQVREMMPGEKPAQEMMPKEAPEGETAVRPEIVPMSREKGRSAQEAPVPDTGMTVGELLEQWDMSPELLGQCLEILKKM